MESRKRYRGSTSADISTVILCVGLSELVVGIMAAKRLRAVFGCPQTSLTEMLILCLDKVPHPIGRQRKLYQCAKRRGGADGGAGMLQHSISRDDGLR